MGIVMNAIPGGIMTPLFTSTTIPNLHGPGIPRSRTCVETNAVIQEFPVQLVLSIVEPQRPIRRRALGEGGKSSRRRDRTGLVSGAGEPPCALDGSALSVRSGGRPSGCRRGAEHPCLLLTLTRNLRSQERGTRRPHRPIDGRFGHARRSTARSRRSAKMFAKWFNATLGGDSGAVVWAPTGFREDGHPSGPRSPSGAGSFARTIVLTTVQLVEQTKTAVGRTAENVHPDVLEEARLEQLEMPGTSMEQL